jgi:hypothetical protein
MSETTRNPPMMRKRYDKRYKADIPGPQPCRKQYWAERYEAKKRGLKKIVKAYEGRTVRFISIEEA